MSLNYVPAGDPIAGGELLEDHSRHRTNVRYPTSDQVAGPGDPVPPGFAHRVGPGPQGAPRIPERRSGAVPTSGPAASVE